MINSIKEIRDNINKYGCIEFSPGVHIWTKEEIIQSQKEWPDEDTSKHMNFNNSNLWVTTDSGETPVGYDNIDEFFEVFRDYLSDDKNE